MNLANYDTVLLLASSESSAAIDKVALRQAGVKHLRFMTSATEAVSFLRSQASLEDAGTKPAYALPEHKVSLVVCNEQLASGDFAGFMSALRGSPEISLPVVAIHSGRVKGFKEKASQGGAASVVCRPYTVDQLAGAMNSALGRMTEGGATSASSPHGIQNDAFGKPGRFQVKTASALTWNTSHAPMTREQSFLAQLDGAESGGPQAPSAAEHVENARKAMASGASDAMEEAGASFKQAIMSDPLCVEACLGLAQTARAAGNSPDVLKWLQRAGSIYLHTGKGEQARAIFSRLPASLSARHQGADPFFESVIDMMEDGCHHEAAQLLLRMRDSGGRDPLHVLMSRACQLTRHPEKNLEELCLALYRSGHERLAANLRKRLLEVPDFEREEEPSGFWERFPRLYTMITVAGYAARSWRHANAS